MWIDIEYKNLYNDGGEKGIRLRFYKGVNDEVRKSCIDFCKWLRTLYWFPMRCNIYIFSHKNFKSAAGKKCTAKFKFFNDENECVVYNPIIWVATGSYENEIKKREKKYVLFDYLGSIAHELTHYYQWYFKEIDDENKTERSLEYMATRWKNYLLEEYWVKLYGVDENGLLKL